MVDKSEALLHHLASKHEYIDTTVRFIRLLGHVHDVKVSLIKPSPPPNLLEGVDNTCSKLTGSREASRISKLGVKIHALISSVDSGRRQPDWI